MITIHHWSGREVRVLREAKRMSVRDFAAHLGISDRMVSKWEAGGEQITPRPVNQEALDTSLSMSSEDVQTRFAEAVRLSQTHDGSGGQPTTTALKRAREASGRSQLQIIAQMQACARRLGIEIAQRDSLKTMLSGWENGKRSSDLTEKYRIIFRAVYGLSDVELGFIDSGSQDFDANRVGSQSAVERLESLRGELNDAISGSAINSSSLDEWDESVLQLGLSARNLSPGIFVADLASDLADLRAALSRPHSASTIHRLTRVAAQISGLMCLTLIKLDDREAFRRWARTARSAAVEAGDSEVTSWVFAQEAYGHFYAGDFRRAGEVARHAQEIARGKPYVGAVLAAALEARNQASMGRSQETHSALHRAESILSRMDDDHIGTSAFAYNEAQLRFHEGNALTHLNETDAAWSAQQRALELYPSEDYMDRALIVLDRANCLARDGDTSGAIYYVTEALIALNGPQRRGIITLRAEEVVSAIPDRDRKLSMVRGLEDLLLSSVNTGREL